MERNLTSTLNSYNQFLFDLVLVALSSGMFTYGLHGAFHNITLAFFLGAVIVQFVLHKSIQTFIPWQIMVLQAGILAVYTLHTLFFHGWDSDVAHLISNKSSILVFAILFTFMPFRTPKAYFVVFLFTFLWLDLETIGALINYYDDINGNQYFTWSGVIHVDLIPFSIMHHHLSVCVAFGIALAIYLLIESTEAKTWFWRLILILQLVYLFIFEHQLASRIGLFITYGFLLIGSVYAIFKFTRFPKLYSILFVLFMGIGFVLLTFTIPTLQKKSLETIQDIQNIERVGINTKYNISSRLFSYRLTWNICKTNLMNGVGYFEFNEKSMQEYESSYPDIPLEQRILCPNQYLKYLACFGLPISILFFMFFVSPSLFFLRKGFVLYQLLVLFTLVYFMSEYPLENINFFYFFAFYSSLLIHFHLSQKVQKSA